MLKCWVLVAAILIVPFDALSRQRALSLEFTPQTPQFATAAEEYRQIWAAEGPRIIAAISSEPSAATPLTSAPDPPAEGIVRCITPTEWDFG